MVSNRLFDRTILTVKHYSFEDCPRCAALPVVTYDGDVFECGCGGCKCYKASSIYLPESIIGWNKWAAKERKRLLNQMERIVTAARTAIDAIGNADNPDFEAELDAAVSEHVTGGEAE